MSSLIQFLKLFGSPSSNPFIRAWYVPQQCIRSSDTPRSDPAGCHFLFLLVFHNNCQHDAGSSEDERSFWYSRHILLLVLDRAHQPPQRRPWTSCVITCRLHDREKTISENSRAVERRPGQILEWYWQRTAQDRPPWRRMQRPSPNHGTLRLPNDEWWWWYWTLQLYNYVLMATWTVMRTGNIDLC